MLNEAIIASGIREGFVRGVYAFGSRVYGTYGKDSDYDFVVVADNIRDGQEIRHGQFNIHLYSPEKFQENISRHKVMPLECLFGTPQHCLKPLNVRFKLNRGRLAHEWLKKAEKSWTKGRKLLEEGDVVRGKKSLFHAVRILMFGLQIAKFDKIVDFGEATPLWQEIIANGHVDWLHHDAQLTPLYTSLVDALRKVR